MTQWVENPRGGRERGPRGLLRAWAEVLVRPRRFFRNGVAPGDQAPGLAFAIAVTFVYVGSRLAFAPASVSGYARMVENTGSVYLSGLVLLGVACFLVAPLALHLAAAVGTLTLIPTVSNRAGVSETVQVIAYATAPGVFVAYPHPAVQLAAALYGCVLLVVGFSVVHETSIPRALAAGLVPAVFVFGFAFGGIAAFESVTGVVVTPASATG
ncbi:YIP1 family protein [Natronomonas amylolytica]|uniref:YIP1 family protein n=1 Tax=Natronomonas amylolytica TaxID=3108498 RepID=UPI00300A6D9A